VPCRAGVVGVYDNAALLPPESGNGHLIVETLQRLSKPFGTKIEIADGRVAVRPA
jgi:hypothetical protein